METTMFDHQILDQQFNAKPLIETMIDTMEIANNERNEAVREVVGNWVRKLRNIASKSVGFGFKLAG